MVLTSSSNTNIIGERSCIHVPCGTEGTEGGLGSTHFVSCKTELEESEDRYQCQSESWGDTNKFPEPPPIYPFGSS